MSRPERLQFLSDLMLLAVAVVWGTSYGVAKSALGYYPVLGLLALRFGITFVMLSPALRPPMPARCAACSAPACCCSASFCARPSACCSRAQPTQRS
jgi:hypothetical protein